MTHGENESAFPGINRVPHHTRVLLLPEMLRAFADEVQKHTSWYRSDLRTPPSISFDIAAGYMRLAADEIEEHRESQK